MFAGVSNRVICPYCFETTLEFAEKPETFLCESDFLEHHKQMIILIHNFALLLGCFATSPPAESGVLPIDTTFRGKEGRVCTKLYTKFYGI